MQINHKSTGVTIKLTQAEGRRMRDAAYIMRHLASNISDRERAAQLDAAAAQTLAAAMEWCPEQSQKRLDLQDAETPPVVEKLPVVEAVPELLRGQSEEPRKFIAFDGLERDTYYRCWHDEVQHDVHARIYDDGNNLWWKTSEGKYFPISSLGAIAKENPS